jgi:hypothetical protein
MTKAALLSTLKRTANCSRRAGSDHHHEHQPRDCLSGGVPPSEVATMQIPKPTTSGLPNPRC